MKRKINKKHPIRNGQVVHSSLPGDKTPYFYFVVGCIAIYNVVISYLSILRFESFSASVYDMGIMIQTIWNTSQGWILQESINMGYPMMRFWMAHWEFIYLPIALVYKLFSTPYTILIIQTFIVSLGALPIYWLAKQKLENQTIAVVLSISYLLYPAIQNANLCDVHGVTFAAPFLLFAFYYLQKRSFKLFTLFSILAIMSREDSALILLMMGVYSFFILKEKKVGIFTALVSFVWFFVWYERMAIRAMLGLPEFVIMAGAETHWDHLGNVQSDPLYLLKFFAKKYNIRYFFYLFGPVALLSLCSPTTLLIAAPIFAINLLSSYYFTHDVEHYYSATITPFIYISAIYGMKNLLKFLKNQNGRFLKYISIVILACSIFFFFIKSNSFDAKEWKITEHHQTIKKIINEIPQEASLSAERKLAVHAAERHEIYAFNDHVDKVDYILYDFYSPTVRLVNRKSFVLPYMWPDNDSIRKVLHNQDYGVVNYEDGVCLFKRDADYEQGIKTLAVAVRNDIENPLNKEIEGGIYCKGYNIHDMLRYYIQPEKLGRIYWKKALHFTCFWNLKNESSDSLKLIFKIQKRNQKHFFDHAPIFGLQPLTTWKSNQVIRDEIFWEIPDQAEPGFYQIHVAINNDSEEKKFVHLFNLNLNE